MTYKVYLEGNYLIVDPQGVDTLVESPRKFVQIERFDSDREYYDITVRGNSVFKGHLSRILKKDGTNYTTEEFKVFRLDV